MGTENDNDDFWDKTAAGYDAFLLGTDAMRAAYAAIERFLESRLDRTMEALELAAGPGTLSEPIASHCKTLIVTDKSQRMIEQAKQRNLPENATIEVADARNLRFPAESFDAVVIANAIHVIPSPAQAVAESIRVLRPGGTFLAPTFVWNDDRATEAAASMKLLGYRTYSHWDQREYIEFLKQNGLEIVSADIAETPFLPICLAECRKPEGTAGTTGETR